MCAEEERDAFESYQYRQHPGCDLRRWADAYRSNIVEAAWQSWLAAKAHAAEMAKPTGRVSQGRMGDWWIEYDVYQCGGFLTAYDAMDWLTSNGYRVVSE